MMYSCRTKPCSASHNWLCCCLSRSNMSITMSNLVRGTMWCSTLLTMPMLSIFFLVRLAATGAAAADPSILHMRESTHCKHTHKQKKKAQGTNEIQTNKHTNTKAKQTKQQKKKQNITDAHSKPSCTTPTEWGRFESSRVEKRE